MGWMIHFSIGQTMAKSEYEKNSREIKIKFKPIIRFCVTLKRFLKLTIDKFMLK